MQTATGEFGISMSSLNRSQRDRTSWSAQWICNPVQGDGMCYAWFHKMFDLEALPDSSVLHITADKRYRLFINGELVGDGSAPSGVHYWAYDSIDVWEFLHLGPNEILVLVQQRYPGDYYAGGKVLAALAQLELRSADGAVRKVVSDPSWRTTLEQGWKQDVPTAFVGFDEMDHVEVYDAGKAAVAFGPGYRPYPVLPFAEWEQVTTFKRGSFCMMVTPDQEEGHRGRPWRKLVARGIPFMDDLRHYPRKPCRIGEVEMGNIDKHFMGDVGAETWQGLEKIDDLAHATVLDIGQMNAEDGTPFVMKAEMATTYPYRMYYPAVVVDLGEVKNGNIEIEVEGGAGTVIDVSHAQILSDGQVLAKSGRQYRVKRYTLGEGRQSWISFEYANCQYIQLTVKVDTPAMLYLMDFEPVRIHRFGFREIKYPTPNKASFKSGDELLDKLFEASARTALLCTNETIMDNTYREKKNWAGDVTAVTVSLAAVYGRLRIVERYFRMFMLEQPPSGNLSTIAPGSNDGLFDHAMAIPIWLAEVIRLTGETRLAAEFYPGLLKYFCFLEDYEDEDGVMREVPWTLYFDWTKLSMEGTISTLNFLYLRTLCAAAVLAKAAGADADVRYFNDKVERLGAACDRLFWNEKRSAYSQTADGDGQPSDSVCEHANALALYCGVGSIERRDRLVESVFGQGMALADNRDVAKCAPEFEAHVLQGLCAAGRQDLVMDFFDQRNLHWIREGRNTIPEVWDQDPRTHDSAVQASTPEAYVLLTEIMGLKPDGFGFGRFVLAPMIQLLPDLTGAMPTHAGEFHVDWKTDEAGTVTLLLQKPESATGVLRIPEGYEINGAGPAGGTGDFEFAEGGETTVRIARMG